jgi:RNA polymerase sigma-70 factor, ECF subfamily
VRAHWRRVYGFCYRFTGKDSDAQDLTLQVFSQAFREEPTDGSFTIRLARLTRNLLIDYYRRTRDSFESSDLFQAALGKLSPELRETIILRDLQTMAYPEIGDVLAIPEEAVKSRLIRGRAELGRLLSAQNQA